MSELKPCPAERIQSEAEYRHLKQDIATTRKIISNATAQYRKRKLGLRNKAQMEHPDTAYADLTLDELKVENAQLRAVITQSDPKFFRRKCRVCGCDWNHPCNDHDYWVGDDLCSACAARKPEGSNKP